MIVIDKGEKKIFEIDLRQASGRPFDLTGYNKFKVCIPTGSGAGLQVTEVVNANFSQVQVLGNPILGILQVVIGKTDSAGLEAGERLAIDIELAKSGDPQDVLRERFVDALNVVDNTCTIP